MKYIFLLTIALIYTFLVNGQTFTIGQSTTGMTQNVFGQGFTPSIQGNGTGAVGTQSQVGLYEFSFMLDATVTPDVLYIYRVLPASKEVLMDGTGGALVGQSTSKTTESYWYTNYQFKNGLVLDKDVMYYALFRKSVNCEVGGGNYTGGDIYRLGSDGTMNTTAYVDTKFKASFAPPIITSNALHDISSILVYPNPTKGDITTSSEEAAVIDVYHLTGVKIKTIKIDRGQSQNSIAELPKGIYMFISEGKVVDKVVKN